MAQPIQTAVVGATGYAGFELTRILLGHPNSAKPLLLSREGDNSAKIDLGDIYPQISGNGGYPVAPFSWKLLKEKGVELLFLATPHEVSRDWMPEAMAQGLRVIDLSGAWRLKSAENRSIYGFNDKDVYAAAKLDQQATYGLPELHRASIKSAQLVANPGCYATSVILGLAPVVKSGLIDLSAGIICDAKSGVSGAGKAPTAKTHFVEVADNLSAYSVFGHRHTGEILEQLQLEGADLVFTPHLLPIPRGILSTMYVRLKDATTVAKIEELYRKFYAESPWVRVFPADKLPQIQYSVRSNYCDVGFTLSPDGKRLVIVSCLDNLIKGAAGQAVQNMNVMFGWNEKEGLN
ncbi:MAG TPA: N-acetyl-gamma-glutamyl-phosphate reductase [Terriglobales bacterium]|nr:N-acetyl-gamma-glutamyl-phosphate reductase [Terriglobales bacterium]